MRSPYECPLSDTGPFPERPAPSGAVPDTNRVKGPLPCPPLYEARQQINSHCINQFTNDFH